MSEFAISCALIVAVIILACIINKFIPPDYHQRVEEKYNKE
jgi:hypothetical protein